MLDAPHSFEQVGFPITHEGLHEFLPYELLGELCTADINVTRLAHDLQKHHSGWSDRAVQQLSAIVGGDCSLPRADEWEAAIERCRAAQRAISDWMCSVLVTGMFSIIGRDNPVAGALRRFNVGFAWERARFDLKKGTAYSPLKRSPGLIYDVRLVPRRDWPCKYGTGAAADVARGVKRQKTSRYAAVDAEAVARMRGLLAVGHTDHLDMARRVLAEMLSQGRGLLELGNTERAVTDRWRKTFAKERQKTPRAPDG